MTTIGIRDSPSGPVRELDSDDIDNASNVSGQTVSDALDRLQSSAGLLRLTLLQTPGAGNHVCLSTAGKVRIRGAAGGGAGGGSNAPAAQANVAGGAGAAGVFDVMMNLVAGQTLAYVLGNPGLGVIGGTGTDGTDTTVTYNGQVFTSTGGLGRGVPNSGTTLILIGNVDGSPASGPAADGVFVLTAQYIKGGPSQTGIRETAASGVAGNGGASAEAPGGHGRNAALASNSSGDGLPGQFGSGGGGSANFNDSPTAGNKGGDGGGPFLYVWEWAA